MSSGSASASAAVAARAGVEAVSNVSSPDQPAATPKKQDPRHIKSPSDQKTTVGKKTRRRVEEAGGGETSETTGSATNPSSTLDVVKAGEPKGGAWTYNTSTVSTGIIHRRDVLDKDVR